MIRHRETNQLLGAHMIGHNATECIAAATAFVQQKASLRDVAETVWAHPTISEVDQGSGRRMRWALACICRRARCCASPRQWREAGTD